MVDLSTSLPDVDYKRGYLIQDAVNRCRDQDAIDYLTKSKALGMTIAAMPKDLNQFDPNYTNKVYYKAYRSLGNSASGYLGANGEAEEFSGTLGGKINVRVNSLYLAACQKAVDYGIQLIVQCSGVPVQGNTDGSVTQLFNLDPTRKFHEQARFYAWPATSDIDTVANTEFTYMKMLKDALGASDVIFAGNQEPSHTAGYPNGVVTDNGTNSNVQNYPSIWRTAANKLKAAGMLSGCSQLNQVSSQYGMSVGAIYNNNVPFDFYTIQNYQGVNNKQVLTDAKNALEKYGYTTHKRVLFDRYDTDDGTGKTNDQRFGTSDGVISVLNCEVTLFDYADMVYGYCYFTGAKNYVMMDSTFKFLNNAPKSRKNLTNLPSGVSGFALLDDNGVSMALWNTRAKSDSIKHLTIDLGNLQTSFSKINIFSLNGTAISDAGDLWAPLTGKIGEITLLPREIYYISLRK